MSTWDEWEFASDTELAFDREVLKGSCEVTNEVEGLQMDPGPSSSKRRRVSKDHLSGNWEHCHVHRSVRGFTLNDEHKLNFCPTILKELMIKILLVDSYIKGDVV